jgi:putative addiction module component (TIGR02574 family)
MATVTEIMDNVMELPRTDRCYIARKLIESLDQDADLSPEWMEEIEKRVARRESGESQSVSSEVVHADIEKILAR